MVKRQFWTSFSLTLAVYLLGIAAAVWVIEPPEAPAAEPVREAVGYSPDPEEDLILLGVMEGEEPVVLLLGFFPERTPRPGHQMPCKESWRSGTASPLTPGFPGNRRAGSSWYRGWGQRPSPWIRTALSPWMGRR